MKKLATLLMLASLSAGATEFATMGYDGFYDRLEVMNKKEFDAVTIQFSLVKSNNDDCGIKDAYLTTEEIRTPVKFNNSGVIDLPYNKHLDKQKAKLIVESESVCTLSMRIQAEDADKLQFSQQELVGMHHQFNEMLDELSGTIISWFTPDVSGLIFDFGSIETAEENREVINRQMSVHCEASRCFIFRKDLDEMQSDLTLATKPDVILPWILR